MERADATAIRRRAVDAGHGDRCAMTASRRPRGAHDRAEVLRVAQGEA
jgi:hypothetical protein